MESASGSVNSIDLHIGRRIRIRRLLLRMSVAEAAVRLGVREQVFEEYEAGLLRLDAVGLIRLSGVFGVRMRYFFDGAEMADEELSAVRRVND